MTISAPKLCQICSKPHDGEIIDGRTIWGYWAWMCKSCHLIYGRGFGMGKGQLFKRNTVESWEKIRG